MYNKLIRAAKKVYFEESLEKNKSNLKKCWDVLREAIRKKNDKSGDIQELKINGNIIKDGLDIATFLLQLISIQRTGFQANLWNNQIASLKWNM